MPASCVCISLTTVCHHPSAAFPPPPPPLRPPLTASPTSPPETCPLSLNREGICLRQHGCYCCTLLALAPFTLFTMPQTCSTFNSTDDAAAATTTPRPHSHLKPTKSALIVMFVAGILKDKVSFVYFFGSVRTVCDAPELCLSRILQDPGADVV